MPSKQAKSKKNTDEPLDQQTAVQLPSTEKTPDKKSSKKSTQSQAAVAISEPEASLKKGKSTAKEKVIRDSFSFPEHDYLKISELKKACLAEGIHVKKGELLRAGLLLLSKLSIAELKQVIDQVEKVKTGRPQSS